jgi:circadian clock protein KaiC
MHAGIDTAAGREDRVTTGTAGLDTLLEGGFPSNRAILIAGEPGTGKTVCALRFVAAGLAAGEPAVYVSVDQKPRHLLDDVRRVVGGLDAAVEAGRLVVLDASPYFTVSRNTRRNSFPVDARSIATDLSQQVARINARRLVIDSLTSLVAPDLTRGEAQDYLRSLLLSLEDNFGCTVLLTSRALASDPQGLGEAAECLASGVVSLQVQKIGDAYVRTLFVKKMRRTHVDPVEIPFQIHADRG